MKTPQGHAPIALIEVRADELQVGGKSLEELARRVGRTPFYAYDRLAIGRRIAALRSAIPPRFHLHYAMKANPMPAVVQHVLGLVDGLDVASGGELRVALDAGALPGSISFAGPGKTALELSQAAAAGIVINVESEREIRLLGAIAVEQRIRPRIAIRVNPDFELKTSGMKMGGGPRQFGIDSERVPQVLDDLKAAPLEFIGFHIFSGSQNLRAEAIIESQRNAVALAVRLARFAPGPLRLLNLGGGFGIPYFPGEVPLDLGPIGTNLNALLPDLEREFPGAEFVIELGRYLVGEAGIYVCRVVDRKVSRGQVFLVTDGGLHHHLAASGNFGQVLRKNYPVVVGRAISGGVREIASVVGPLCTPLDLLADRIDIAVAGEGDLIAVLQSGAYGLSASPTGFLSHPRPAEILV